MPQPELEALLHEALADNSVFADPHVQIGVVAGDGGAAIWPLLCGLGRAKRYLMLGDRIDAEEAERIGLVDWVVPVGDRPELAETRRAQSAKFRIFLLQKLEFL